MKPASAVVLLLLAASTAVAQRSESPPQNPVAAAEAEPARTSAPDVAILARVTARELSFHEPVGTISVTFRGGPDHQNVWETERINLPKPVEPKVIYRDIGVILTITSTLPNIEQIVDEALGLAGTAEQPGPPDPPDGR